jgi:hypothetical protein
VGNRNGNGNGNGRQSVTQHKESQQQSSSHGSSSSLNSQREFARRTHRDSTQSFVDRGQTNGNGLNGHSATNGHSAPNGRNGRNGNGNGNGNVPTEEAAAPCDKCKKLGQLEDDIKDLFSRPSLTTSGRADIPIEHDNEPELQLPEPEEPQPEMREPETEVDSGRPGYAPVQPVRPAEPEPEPYVPEPEPYVPEPLPETEPAYVPEPIDSGAGGEPVEYEETDQIICEEDEQQNPTGDQDYVGGGCGGSPSMTATSSIFEHQVSMISVPIPAMIDHVSSSNSNAGSFMSTHHQLMQQQQQPSQPIPARQQPQPIPARQQPQPGPAMVGPQPKLMSGSKHVTSSSYSKTYISSGFVPMGSQPANVQQPTIIMPSLPSSPGGGSMSSSSSSMSSMSSSSMSSSMSSSNKGSSGGCQASGYTYKCQIVYGPVKRTKICETVPIESTGSCCSIC